MANVEIYIESVSLEKVEHWIVAKFGELKVMGEDEEVKVFHGILDEDVFPIIVQKCVEGKPIIGVWFNSVFAPWESDADCAREAYEYFQSPIECDPGDKIKGDHLFLRIDHNGESIISLK